MGWPAHEAGFKHLSDRSKSERMMVAGLVAERQVTSNEGCCANYWLMDCGFHATFLDVVGVNEQQHIPRHNLLISCTHTMHS